MKEMSRERRRKNRRKTKSEQGKDDTNDAEKNFPIIYHHILKVPY